MQKIILEDFVCPSKEVHHFLPKILVTLLVTSLTFSPLYAFARDVNTKPSSFCGVGIATTTSSAFTTPYQYTSENTDSETGLTYLRARYYDPSTGRFISRDPVRGTLDNPITQNPYVYGGDNPVMYTDPSGKFVPILLAGIGIVWMLFSPEILSPCGDVNPSSELISQTNTISNFVLIVDIGTSFLGNGSGLGKIAAKIAAGHALAKHLDEFAILGIKTESEFAKHIESIISNSKQVRILQGGRAAFMDESTKTIVMFDPNNLDLGTTFIRQTDIQNYFFNLLK